MGLPEGAIRHKMMQDGIPNEGIESFFNQVSGETINDGKNEKKIEKNGGGPAPRALRAPSPSPPFVPPRRAPTFFAPGIQEPNANSPLCERVDRVNARTGGANPGPAKENTSGSPRPAAAVPSSAARWRPDPPDPFILMRALAPILLCL